MRKEGRAAEGIELVGFPAGATRPAVGSQLAQRGQAPYYNPLDERVQAAIVRVVEELASRYAHHASFAGICLQLGAESYLVLPDDGWPCDDRTIARFQREAQVQVPGSGADRYRQRSLYLAGEGRQLWSDWRTGELARFYRSLQQQLATLQPNARLYLATEGLLTGRPAQLELRPRLLARTDISQVLLRHGIDPAARGKDDPIALLRPARTAPLTSLVAQSVNVELDRSATVDACFRGGANRGALNYHEPLTLRLPEFDAQSPFGAENTFTWLAAHVAPAGVHNRAHFIHGLAALDAQILVEGGWMLPLGQEEPLRGLFEVYRQLPAADFQTPAPQSPSAAGFGRRGADVDARRSHVPLRCQ